ncbi:hypothetical protein [Silvanigrella aquatica]|uniref:Uncharacterized protein n=1 Tax=Silvanigrella aquatica TaxID=1915309 RepID=A0A1L4CYH5_9BACT|nr:hypothetical protein [Silvanigrella aquatica]APJ03013.1 hypothetical protein AXG55_03415 [Silvanigrella aquatica]
MVERLFLIVLFQAFIFIFQNKSFATPKETLPLGTQVDWEQLINENQSPIAKQFVQSSYNIYERLLYGGIPYPSKKITTNWEKGYQEAYDKFVYMRKNGVDCTRLLRYLFLNMLHLPYNSNFPNEPIISNTFAYDSNSGHTQLKYFTRLPKVNNGFKPQTGDILAFPGHTIAVLDPKNCIAIQSSIWLCKKIENGFCVDSEYGKSAGVSIYRLASERFCKNGIWKGMDNENLNFTVGWRHRAFDTWIIEMPDKAIKNSRVTLVGKNISGKYIYFTGSKQPVRTKLLKTMRTGLQTVTLNIPKDAKSGYLKLYWGTGKPQIENTIESAEKIIILDKKEAKI